MGGCGSNDPHSLKRVNYAVCIDLRILNQDCRTTACMAAYIEKYQNVVLYRLSENFVHCSFSTRGISLESDTSRNFYLSESTFSGLLLNIVNSVVFSLPRRRLFLSEHAER